MAHSGAHPVRFVAQSGVDKGSCNQPITPCKTINYAVEQSGKGDEVHVAKGDYTLQSMDSFYVLSDMVIVRGGYSIEDKFRSYAPEKNITRLIGLPSQYRAQLASRGFALLRDNKNDMSAQSIKQLRQLDVYHKINSNIQSKVKCVDGKAGEFPCDGIDLVSHMPLSTFSSNPTSANDIWGFVDLNDNKEYAIIGLRNGTAVIDVSTPDLPKEVGTITGPASTWRDIKVLQRFDQDSDRYKAYAYVTTEASGGGLQVIDLTDLPNSVSLGAKVSEFSTAHNVYMSNVDYATGLALDGLTPHIFIAGSSNNGGAFRIFDVTNPLSPNLVSSPTLGSYVHDATSLVIDDERTSQCASGHNPCELFVDFNENTVDIWDVTDKQNIEKLSSTGYTNAAYTHSGWWSADKKYIFIQDELDEQRFGVNTTMKVLDISNLTAPSIAGSYIGKTQAIDHNGFTLGDEYYLSNYRRGLSILDVSDPTNPTDKHYFDTFPIPSSNSAQFNGAWGTYPYLPSGNILVSDIEYGLFVLEKSVQSAGNISFAASEISVNENAGSLSISLTREDGALGATSVQVTSVDGTATSQVDYQPIDTTLTWNDGESGNKTFELTLIDDEADESTETITLQLTLASGEATLTDSSKVISIIDDETFNPGSIEVTTEDRNISEGDSVTITVNRTGGGDGAQSLAYTSQSGTAMADQDFTQAEGTITWTDGESGEKTITINTTNDAIEENEEQFTLTITQESGDASFTNSTINIVISANDEVVEKPKKKSGSMPVSALLLLLLVGIVRRKKSIK
jgi:choice-of-anchor B domain-containing protein